jgi:hypothetical protein
LDAFPLTDLTPTSELVDLLTTLMALGNCHTTTLAAEISVAADWSMLFSVAKDEKSISMLLRILLFLLSADFPIHRLSQMTPQFRLYFYYKLYTKFEAKLR